MMTIETNFEPYNLNDYLKVKLNADGFSVWKLEHEKYLPVKHHEPLENYKAKADADGYVQFQAWVFIQLFGRYIYMAGPMLYDTTVLIQRPLPPLPPPRRSLSSLTETEAREVYRLAFGREPYDKLFGTNDSDGQFEIFDYAPEGRRWDITLWEGGRMSATITNQQHQPLYQCPPFAATKVGRYLDSLGIEIG